MDAVEAVYYALAAVMALGAGAWALLVLNMTRSLMHTPPLGGGDDPPGPPPRVSVIIPARNEERFIGGCLESLAAQDYPDYEVIVVDDSSEDSTGKIIAGFAERHEVIKHARAGPKPDGWVGKAWPCSEGIKKSGGEVLLVTDADSVHTPDMLSASVRSLKSEDLDALTVAYTLRTFDFWTRITHPVLSAMRYREHHVANPNDPERNMGAFSGCFYMIRRPVYEAVGGHEAIRGDFREDVMMSTRIKEAGYRMMVFQGIHHVSATGGRNRRETWRTMGRMVSGLRQANRNVLPIVSALALLLAAPFPALAASLLIGGPGSWALAAASGASAALMFAGSAIMARHKLNIGARYAVFAPLGGMVVVMGHIAAMVNSQITWRDRSYRSR
ncbi:MAG: glycosyltransferase [Nitrosopumilus sp.]|nr:glycosyltransferase [Nitrosopumilus sp.]